MTRVPRFGAFSRASGAIVNEPLPSDDQRQASLAPGAAGVDGDFVRDHEGRVEADAELADEGGGFLARVLRGKLVQEGLGAGAGDGAEAFGQVFAGHADAVVREGQRLGVRIDRDLDRERRAVLDEFGLGDRFVAQLLAGVGGVGDELADENLPVGIDRMDHEMQQARNVGLEALGLRLRWSGSGRRRSKVNLSKNVEIGNAGRDGAANRISGRGSR